MAEEEIVSKKQRKPKAEAVETPKEFFTPEYDSILDSVEKKFKLSMASTDIDSRRESCLSTGVLVIDLITGCGISPGMETTILGGEASGKSTLVMNILNSAVENNIPNTAAFDFEGAIDIQYLENQLTALGSTKKATDIFGLRDEKGKWIVKPKARLYHTDIMEDFFDSMASLCRALPDKINLDNQWWYVYPADKDAKKIVGENFNKKLYTEFGKYFMEAENGKAQGLFLVDSFPAMLPSSLDDDDPSAGLAAMARAFSANIPKLSGKLRKKAVSVIGVNQLRQIPMAMYGPSVREPGGDALKYWSSCRLQITQRSIPHGKGSIEEEPSVQMMNGIDKYRYSAVKCIKNKNFSPYLESYIRIWFSDANGNGRGIDPVYDCYRFIQETGQLQGNMKKMSITMGDLTLPKLNWLDFKALILLQGEELKHYCSTLGIEMNPKIRDRCFAQLKSGEAHRLYFENQRNTSGAEASDDE